MTNLEREEMKELSRRAFGCPSRWTKVMKTGKKEPDFQHRYNDKGELEKIVPLMKAGKRKNMPVSYTIVSFTVETLKTYMQEMINLRKRLEEDSKKRQLAEIEFVEPILSLPE